MYKNYLIIAWRNIIRQKGFSLINIFGLAVGLAASLILFIYISNETGFDRFHKHGDKIYRVVSVISGETDNIFPNTLPEIGSYAKENSPLVNDYLKLKPETYNVRVDGKEFEYERFFMTDPSFADFFDFKVSSGDLRHTLSDPSSVVLSWELAEKLFGNENPINKTIEVEQLTLDIEMRRLSRNYVPLRVGAVLEPLPKNTFMRFSGLQSYEALDPSYSGSFALDVYVFLKTNNTLSEANKEDLAALIKPRAVERFGKDYEDMLRFILQPFHDIYFGEYSIPGMGIRGNLNLIYSFSVIAFFILFIAIINFVNLVTARSEKRAVEASIRKVSGANRSNIIFQFLGESVLVSLFALIVAVLFVEIFISPFSNLLGTELNFLDEFSFVNIIKLTGLVMVIGVVAGTYPAIIFSRFRPAEILRGKARGGHKNPLLRIVLVVIQFAISVFLIISITVFERQINYMKTADLGFSPENVIVYSGLTDRVFNGYEPIKAELLQHPGIKYVTASHAFPGGGGGSGMSLRRAEDPGDKAISITEFRIFSDYKETFGLNIADGRWFDFNLQTDLDNFVVNESAVKALGLEKPVGQDVVMFNRRGRIIGVVEDFHIFSLKSTIEPLIISAYSSGINNIAIKIDDNNQDALLDYINKTFSNFDPNFKTNALFLENRFKHQYYQQERNTNKILVYASALAIIIAMLGIWGLSSYVIEARKKEINLRKVMGATIMQINYVMFKDIARWILLANAIAWPVAWYVMTRWLENYPYRINMSVGYLLAAGLISILIVSITISGLTIKVSRANPADALRTE